MSKIKEDLKEKLRQGLKKISKQVLSSNKLTEVSGGDGVKEFVSTTQEWGLKDVGLPDFSVNVKVEVKDGVVTFRLHKEIGQDDFYELMKNTTVTKY